MLVLREYQLDYDVGELVEGYRVVLRRLVLRDRADALADHDRAVRKLSHFPPELLAPLKANRDRLGPYTELLFDFVSVGEDSPDDPDDDWRCWCRDDVGTDYLPTASMYGVVDGGGGGDMRFWPIPPKNARILFLGLKTVRGYPAGLIAVDLESGAVTPVKTIELNPEQQAAVRQ